MSAVPAYNPAPALGEGIFTVRDVADILNLPPAKVRHWLNTYWDGRFGSYSWKTDNSKAVNFSTLIEFYVTLQLHEQGIPNREIFKAHKSLSKHFKTPFPFAQQDILDALHCDGKKLFIETNDGIISADGTRQLNLDIIRAFIRNIEFGADKMPAKLYPRGKENAVVVDPTRQFGHPVLNDTNVYPETVYNMYLAEEPLAFIAYSYQLTEKEVNDAIEYCRAA